MNALFENHRTKFSYMVENRNDLAWFRRNPKKKKRIRPLFDWEIKQYGELGGNIVGVEVAKRNPKGLVKKFFGADHPKAKLMTS